MRCGSIFCAVKVSTMVLCLYWYHCILYIREYMGLWLYCVRQGMRCILYSVVCGMVYVTLYGRECVELYGKVCIGVCESMWWCMWVHCLGESV